MSNGIKVTVTHSDFDEREARDMFVKLLLEGWPEVREGQGIEQTPVCEVDDDPEVRLFFAYGDDDLDVRDAEVSVAAAIATMAMYVMQLNQLAEGSDWSVYPAHAFAIERDVPMPVSEEAESTPARRRVAARSSN